MTVMDMNLINGNGTVRATYIYMVFCDAGNLVHIKVGVSDSPLRRACEIKTMCPIKPHMLGYCEVGGRKQAFRIETRLHANLAHWRSQGEWFCVPISESAKFREVVKQTLESHERRSMPASIHVVDLKRYFMHLKEKKRAYQREISGRSVAVQQAIKDSRTKASY